MMKYFCGFLAIFITATGAAYAKSLLQAASFPTTFQDVPFTDRMITKATGYEPWESEYDSAGRCITNCPYAGITIEDDLKMMERQTQQALNQLTAAGLIRPTSETNANNNGTANTNATTGTAPTPSPV